MAPKDLSHLPPELLQAILVHAILVRGLKRGLRLRLVSKSFSRTVIEALYTSKILEDLCRLPHRFPTLCLEYLQFRTVGQRGYVTAPRRVIRQVADLLCVENNIPVTDVDTTRDIYIKQLCSLAFRRNNCLSSYFQGHRSIDDNDQALQRHLFVAAVYTNSLSLVQRLVQGGCSHWAVSSLFGLSLTAAALQGHDEILEMLLSTCSPHSIRRYMALTCAAEEGNFSAVELVLQPRWGSWDLENGNSRDRAALNKALNTPSLKVFRRIMAARENTPLGDPLSKSLIDELINTCASNGWDETMECLLDMGAPSDGYNISSKQRPIIDACGRGFIDIVRLLLQHGADTGGALTKAAAGGYLGIVRMLLDHGCDVNEGSPPPIVCAIELEHETMFSLLRERGAVLNTLATGTEAAGRAKAAGLHSMLALLSREGVDIGSAPPIKIPLARRCFCPGPY